MTAAQITVPEFLKVRAAVALALKQDSSTQAPTRIRQAENLMSAGFVDIAAVLASIPEATVAEPEGEFE